MPMKKILHQKGENDAPACACAYTHLHTERPSRCATKAFPAQHEGLLVKMKLTERNLSDGISPTSRRRSTAVMRKEKAQRTRLRAFVALQS
jgi:hypothetical protein